MRISVCVQINIVTYSNCKFKYMKTFHTNEHNMDGQTGRPDRHLPRLNWSFIACTVAVAGALLNIPTTSIPEIKVVE